MNDFKPLTEIYTVDNNLFYTELDEANVSFIVQRNEPFVVWQEAIPFEEGYRRAGVLNPAAIVIFRELDVVD